MQAVSERVVPVFAKQSAWNQRVLRGLQQARGVSPTGRDIAVPSQSAPFTDRVVLVHSNQDILGAA